MKILISLALAFLCSIGTLPTIKKNTDKPLYYGDGYNGAIMTGTETETITYASKDETEYAIKGGLPTYYDTSSRPKTCANVAGAIVLGYYDKTYDELIPNFTSARVIRDKILYNVQTEAVQAVVDSLYVKMETNVTSGGTSVAGFKNGLKKYVNEKGKNLSYSETGQNSQLNKTAFIQSIQNSHPVALFVSKYTLIPIMNFSISSTEDKLNKTKFEGNHVLVSYGLKEVNYYNANGTLKRKLILLLVATGFYQEPLCYIELSSNSGMIESYSINVY